MLMVPKTYPENLKSIGTAIAEQCLKTCHLNAGAIVSITDSPFDVYDMTSNTYNVFPPLVVIFYYRLRENLTSRSSGGQGIRERVVKKFYWV